MPADLDLLMGTSPPMFGGHGSVYGGGFLGCGNYHNLLNDQANALFNQFKQNTNMNYTSSPPRSCLIFRHESSDDSCFGKDLYPPLSPTKLKKRVVFADDRGFQLTQVRVMTEPSNCPPKWTHDFVEHITNRLPTSEPQTRQWVLNFVQPVSNYIAFREKLDKNCASLENVTISNDVLSGTMKVKNISFRKEVFIRITYDGWKNYEDVPATYVRMGTEGTAVISIFDTFNFNIKVPPNLKINKIEMCACFRCDGVEYWDSNDGHNYTITVINSTPKNECIIPKSDDAMKITRDSWADFASWNDLMTPGPYW